MAKLWNIKVPRLRINLKYIDNAKNVKISFKGTSEMRISAGFERDTGWFFNWPLKVLSTKKLI